MKNYPILFLTCALTTTVDAAPFQNLGFEEANTNNIVDTSGHGTFAAPASEMLPGWRLSSIIGEATFIHYNLSPLGDGFASLYDTNFLNFGAPPPVEGKYGLGLWPGNIEGFIAPFHLSQTGDVPADAKRIQFINFGGPFELRVDGELVPLIYEYPPNYPPPLFARGIPVPVLGDISPFSGKTVELDFITLSSAGPNSFDSLKGIDSISFSPELIPEPGTWALCSLGALGFLGPGLFRRMRK